MHLAGCSRDCLLKRTSQLSRLSGSKASTHSLPNSRQTQKQHGRHQPLQVSAGFASIAGVLFVSVLPFATVQSLASSGLGKKLQTDLERAKPKMEKEERERRKIEAQARSQSMWFGAERPKWLGPLNHDYPNHLRGEAPADYGYDVLSLGTEPDAFARNFELELLHSRWAMLGAFGALLPEVLQYTGLFNFAEPRWWNVGYTKLRGEDLNYLGLGGFRIAGNQGIAIIAICQVVLMFGPEYARSCGTAALEPLGVYLPGTQNYPGGIFDPLGLSKDPYSIEDLKVKEMKNGRLAMVAWLGFFIQAAVTQKGPVENLLDFIHDPAHNNVLKYLRQ
ncbi:hypothetical protein WJX74_008691 [Apatococcus lobatus]|uniref:Chlorophyll a-b binding protein, chloroplastic n=1 Tax=Apatococcus lobatus TaxID=904363 RepID=A0AAW1SHJ1_9CHLO